MLRIRRINPFDLVVRQVAIASIKVYQRYISPHKGFACAHRLLYGGESCSGYVKRAIAQNGLLEAWSSAGERFGACKEASLLLRSQHSEDSESQHSEDSESHKEEQKRWQTSENSCHNAVNLCDCSLFGCEAASAISDCSVVDCGSLGCSGCDCASISFGILSPRFFSYRLYNKRPQL